MSSFSSTAQEGHCNGLAKPQCSLFVPPATKLRQDNVFTHVCDSVYRGVSLSGVSLSRGISVQGVSVQGGVCPGWSLFRGVCVGGLSGN